MRLEIRDDSIENNNNSGGSAINRATAQFRKTRLCMLEQWNVSLVTISARDPPPVEVLAFRTLGQMLAAWKKA